jgi:hypothetical protein
MIGRKGVPKWQQKHRQRPTQALEQSVSTAAVRPRAAGAHFKASSHIICNATAQRRDDSSINIFATGALQVTHAVFPQRRANGRKSLIWFHQEKLSVQAAGGGV